MIIRNKYLGLILLAVSLALFFVVSEFAAQQQAYFAILHQNCNLPAEICPYSQKVSLEALGGYSISLSTAAMGLFLFLTDKKKPLRPPDEKYQKLKSGMSEEEKNIYELITSSDGVMFQSDIVEKTSFQKVRVTRILDKLEAKGLVERRRRGMSNVVIVKN